MAKSRSRCCIVSVAFSVIMSILLSVLLWFFLADSTPSTGVAMCGDCHCIPSTSAVAGESQTCPAERPKTQYSAATVEALRRQRPINPYQLKCDPYDNQKCQLDPPQDDTIDLGDSAVCGLVYQFPLNIDSELASNTEYLDSADDIFGVGTVKNAAGESQQQANNQLLCPDAPQEYLMISYDNEQSALADGATVTHHGACGACSTTQDLAVYLTVPDLTTATKECIKRSILNQDEGIACLENDIGFTNACAKIWMYNGENTGQRCTLPCAAAEIQNYANNGPAPECALNGCLACDAEQSGPTFERVAGRTRRRSGVLTTIARPCEDMVMIDHDYACPSEASSSSSSSSVAMGGMDFLDEEGNEGIFAPAATSSF
mmetsp:Transcript_28930/g.84031  ORF Transcript_28930/g.84031 Transcript_28930/m.84031 type:complete len:374 (+) Transcript_28930:218-1339(+)